MISFVSLTQLWPWFFQIILVPYISWMLFNYGKQRKLFFIYSTDIQVPKCQCRNVMLRVDAKQGAPKDGNSPLELFQVTLV